MAATIGFIHSSPEPLRNFWPHPHYSLVFIESQYGVQQWFPIWGPPASLGMKGRILIDKINKYIFMNYHSHKPRLLVMLVGLMGRVVHGHLEDPSLRTSGVDYREIN